MRKKEPKGTRPEEGEDRTAEWGYRKTDPRTWWKKGCASPNPKGRGKGRKNQKTLYRGAFEAKIEVKVNGKTSVLTKDEVAYTQFANRCAEGDPKAMALKLQYDARFEDPEPPNPSPEQSRQHLKHLDHYIEIRRTFARPDEGGDHE